MRVNAINPTLNLYKTNNTQKDKYVRLIQNDYPVGDSVAFKGNLKNNLVKYGKYAFCIASEVKPIPNKVERIKAVEAITAGASVLAAATTLVYPATIGLMNIGGATGVTGANTGALLTVITTSMLERIQNCYPGVDKSKQLTAKLTALFGGGLLGNAVGDALALTLPQLGNGAYAITTAVLHEITGNLFMLYLEKGNARELQRLIDPETLEKEPQTKTIKLNDTDVKNIKKLIEEKIKEITESKGKTPEFEALIAKYSSPEMQNLINKIKENLPAITKNYLAVEQELAQTSRIHIFKRKKLKAQKEQLLDSYLINMNNLFANKLQDSIAEYEEQEKLHQSELTKELSTLSMAELNAKQEEFKFQLNLYSYIVNSVKEKQQKISNPAILKDLLNELSNAEAKINNATKSIEILETVKQQKLEHKQLAQINPQLQTAPQLQQKQVVQKESIFSKVKSKFLRFVDALDEVFAKGFQIQQKQTLKKM